MRRFIDPFLVGLLAVMVVGLVVPMPAGLRGGLDTAADVAIFVLFLLYGARLATTEVIAGLKNLRLQGATLAITFVLFPLFGLGLAVLARPLLGEALADGMLYLSLLPSTVQSSVALVGVARGNVAGALTAATVSNLSGMLLTPLLVLLLMHTGGGTGGGGGIGSVLLLLLLPFVLGQIAQPWIGDRVRARKKLTTIWDRGTILIVVLVAVTSATATGVWSTVSPLALAAVIVLCGLLLAVVLAVSWWGGRLLGLTMADRIPLLMCGSQKSLATGLPMLAALFPAAAAGPIAVPAIVFHQIQLVVSTVIARRLADRTE